MACPDWPLCYGQFFPPMVGNIRFEHGHRLIAAAVGFLTLASALSVWRDGRKNLRPFAAWAVGAVAAQIILGGLTVIFRLPDLVSTAHLSVGTAFFILLVFLTLRAREESPAERVEVDATTRVTMIAAAILTYAQMVLGALVRHSESGLACPDVPKCLGEWIPAIFSPAGLHMTHRAGGMVVWAAISLVFFRTLQYRRVATWAAAAFGLSLFQIIFGIFSVTAKLALWAVMAHLGIAEAMLACLAVMIAKTCASRPVAQPEFSAAGA